MAISFVRAKAISRGSGQSAVACSAYRSCERLVSESGKQVFNYTKKTGLIEKGFHCPEGLEMSRKTLESGRSKREKERRSTCQRVYSCPAS